jgi:hypothetical protein
LENLEEIDTFVDTYYHPKLNPENINHLNRLTKHNEIEAEIKSLPEKYHTFKEELIPTLLKFFHKIEKEGRLPNSFLVVSIMFIPKLDKATTKKENYRPISLINIDAKLLKKYRQTKFNSILKRSYTMPMLASSQGCRNSSTYTNH